MTVEADFKFYKKNGFLIKKDLISKNNLKIINKEIQNLRVKKFNDKNFFEHKIINKKNI